MSEKTSFELYLRLVMNAGQEPSSDPRVDALVTIVLDLLMEVESLRRAIADIEPDRTGEDSTYGRAYRETADLTHNNAGPSDGYQKLLEQFYPRFPGPDGRSWREALLMERLGFSEEAISEFKQDASEAEGWS